MSGLRISLAARVAFSPALAELLRSGGRLLSCALALPSLDALSRRTGGPGYSPPPDLPAPGVRLAMKAVVVDILNDPFECWLQNMQELWRFEAREQVRGGGWGGRSFTHSHCIMAACRTCRVA